MRVYRYRHNRKIGRKGNLVQPQVKGELMLCATHATINFKGPVSFIYNQPGDFCWDHRVGSKHHVRTFLRSGSTFTIGLPFPGPLTLCVFYNLVFGRFRHHHHPLCCDQDAPIQTQGVPNVHLFDSCPTFLILCASQSLTDHLCSSPSLPQ